MTPRRPFESEALVSLVLEAPMTLSDLRQFLVFTTTIGMAGDALVFTDKVPRDAITVRARMDTLGRED